MYLSKVIYIFFCYIINNFSVILTHQPERCHARQCLYENAGDMTINQNKIKNKVSKIIVINYSVCSNPNFARTHLPKLCTLLKRIKIDI